ncbi:MAG TPA: hypothetical protein VFK05_27140 [Polyangiaceae bacterium]|nr:hypothetical protein [Polyangiaceae bacterium]
MAHSSWLGGFPHFPSACRRSFLTLAVGLAAACGSSDPVSADVPFPTSFFSGGAPAIAQPRLATAGSPEGPMPTPGSGAGGGSALADPCAVVPQGQLALIDDFEDDNQDAVPEPGREAFWFPLKDDEASTGILVPEKVFLGGVAGGAHGSAKAAHITASGFSVWGAAFAANISHLEDNIRCPFNASRFSGYRFYARGSGMVYVTLQIPAVVDEQYGGTCRPSAGDICYDSHGIWITLTSDWQAYSFNWSEFRQRGFGKPAPFNPGTIMGLQFNFEKEQLPVDCWLDDVSWDDGSPFPVAGTAGSAGAGGMAGLAGAAGLGGAAGLAGSNSLGGVSGLGGTAGASGGAGQGNP